MNKFGKFTKKKLMILSIITLLFLNVIFVSNVNGEYKQPKNEYLVEIIEVNSVNELISESIKIKDSGNDYRYSYIGDNGLMIESGKITRTNWKSNSYVSFDLDFTGAPVVITNANDYEWACISSPVSVDSNGFSVYIEEFGLRKDDATVSWIAVYPHEFEDPDTGLMIEADKISRSNWITNDHISYDLDFPSTPYVFSNAHKASDVLYSCAGNLDADGFDLHIKNNLNLWITTAEAFYIAVYPHEYEDPNSNLMIESDIEWRTDWFQNNIVDFDLDFPAKPVVVTNAQRGGNKIFASSQNNVYTNKFKAKIVNHVEVAINLAWLYWIAIYPQEWEENNPPNTPTRPDGPSDLLVNEKGSFCTSAIDPDEQDVQYRFDWDAGGSHDYSSWTSYVPSGTTECLVHSWDSPGTYTVKAQARDIYEMPSEWSSGLQVTVRYNQPPKKPSTPSGPTSGAATVEYTYSSTTTDPDGDQIYYMFDWGDGTDSGWIGPYGSGQTGKADHKWSEEGIYEIKVKAKDEYNAESVWSDSLSVEILGNVAYLEISEIKGGYGASAVIKNTGAATAFNIDCVFTVEGVIFGKVDGSRDISIPLLDPGDQTTIPFDNPTMGFDIVDITVETSAPDVDPASKSARGIQILYWIFLFPEE